VTRGARHRRRTAAAPLTLALSGALALGGCSTGTAEDDGIKVTGAFMPEPVMADLAGGFLTVENHGEQDDTLTRVTSGVAASVEMHRTTDGSMQRVDSLPIPAGGRLRLSRGGKHLMFHDLERKPAKGDTVTVKLHFTHHDPVTVTVPVKAAHHDPADGRRP
jgi:periplasmic copper chaperone A